MGDDRDTTSQSKVWINGREKPGIMTSENVTHPPLEIDSNGRVTLPVASETLLESINDLEKYAKLMVEEGVLRQFGNTEAESFSLLQYAKEFEETIIDLKRDVTYFESNYADSDDSSYFYFAVENALKVGRARELLAIKMFELDIVRGSDESYDHQGASTAEQREAVTRIHDLMHGDNPLKKTAAVTQVAREYKKSKSTIFGWINKTRK